jgi:hypothetical protein
MGTTRGGNLKKIHHPYQKWEEYKKGMWKSISRVEAEKLLPLVVKFTGNHIEYGKAMFEVLKTWKYSCEDKLTDISLNRKAWLGHAACCLKFGWPESIVREGWKLLNNNQRNLANEQAEKAILYYLHFLEQKKQTNQLTLFDETKNREIYKRMGE